MGTRTQQAPPSPRVFIALLSGNIKELLASSSDDLRPFLPSLARMVLVPPIPTSLGGMAPECVGQGEGEARRRAIHTAIAGIREVNAIKSYLELNFQVF